jgi:hypothetical protein
MQMPSSFLRQAQTTVNAANTAVKRITNLPNQITESVEGIKRQAQQLADSVSPLTRMLGVGGSDATSRVFSPMRGDQTYNALVKARGRKDPLLSIDWYTELPNIAGLTLGWEMVEQATIPLVEFEPVSNYRAGKMYHYPSHQSLGTLSLTHYEDVNGQTTNYYRTWQGLIMDPETGLYNVPDDYKKTVRVTLLDVTKKEVLIFTYYGCWPSRIESYSLVSGSPERITPAVELTVDDMVVVSASLSSGDIESILQGSESEFPASLNRLAPVFPSATSASNSLYA